MVVLVGMTILRQRVLGLRLPVSHARRSRGYRAPLPRIRGGFVYTHDAISIAISWVVRVIG